MSAQATPINTYIEQVHAALDLVSDPELDESVIELGFVSAIEVDAEGGVDIHFRLPTYWCAANFAFLMADDMRCAVAALPWVTRVAVQLVEHMNDAQINQGLAQGLSFDQTFGNEATGNLDEVREIFAIKAFQRRQEKLLRYLLSVDYAVGTLVSLSLTQLAAMALDSEGQNLRTRYLQRRQVIAPAVPTAGLLAFVNKQGAPILAETLPVYLRGLRLVSINTDFNGALCRGLLAQRYGTDASVSLLPANVHPIHFVASTAALHGRVDCSNVALPASQLASQI